MNIGITCYPTYGGRGTVATELGNNLARRGDTVHFVTTSMPYRLSEFTRTLHFPEVQVFNYPLFDYVPYTLSLASKMAQTAIKENIDLFHVHYAVPHAQPGISPRGYLQERAAAPDHHHPPRHRHHARGNRSLVFRDHQILSIEESDAVTAVSDYLMRQTRETSGPKCPFR